MGGRLAMIAAATVLMAIGTPWAARPDRPVGMADPGLLARSSAVQASDLAQMRSVGLTSVRFDARWDWVQYEGPGRFDWAALDRSVEAATTAGMSVDLIIHGCPAWAAAAPGSGRGSPAVPASATQFADWATAVVTRYAPRGVHVFEVWNEPNNVAFWGPVIDAAAYTAQLKAAYAAIKAADPTAFVISGGLAPAAGHPGNQDPVTFLAAMYAHGAADSFDAVGYHPYSYPAPPNRFESSSGWSKMARTDPSIRSVMISHGDGSKQVWITEVGAPTSGPHGVGEAAQATVVTQAIDEARRLPWVGAVYLYSWRDDGADPADDEDWFGLLTADGRPKPAYVTLRDALRDDR